MSFLFVSFGPYRGGGGGGGGGDRDTTERTGDSTLVYGEITFKTLALALHKIKTKYGLPGVGHSGDAGILQEPGGTFYDIGSGTGKPVRASTMEKTLYGTVLFVCVRVWRVLCCREAEQCENGDRGASNDGAPCCYYRTFRRIARKDIHSAKLMGVF